ncbi:MAG TPA: hypothetical protein DCO75_07560 [Fibrobacteres bacterium]|nr:hypothetical protein [Fibrobacterota bacterium]
MEKFWRDDSFDIVDAAEEIEKLFQSEGDNEIEGYIHWMPLPSPHENKLEEIENSICISQNGIDEGNLGNRPYKTIDYAMQKFRLGMTKYEKK